jgi:hypothetical protein
MVSAGRIAGYSYHLRFPRERPVHALVPVQISFNEADLLPVLLQGNGQIEEP